MNAGTERLTLTGPAGDLELAIDSPAELRGVAVFCHPHPQHGGTMDNKVVQTLARSAVQQGYRAVRFNFRGVGASAGHYDAGHGEVDDALAVIRAQREPALPLIVGGFSFGAAIATQAAARLAEGERAARLILVGTAVEHFPAAPVPQDSIVIHGEADEVVPLTAVLDWARPQTLPVTVVPGVGHFFHGQLSLLKQLVTLAWAHP